MRVLVTGACGYLGHAVVRELMAAGHTVRGLAHRTPAGVADGVDWVRGDLLDPYSLGPAAAGVDGVVHLAALTRVRESFTHSDRYRRVNVGGTVNLLERLADDGLRMVLASTAGVYGTPGVQPIVEEAPFRPLSPYAASKVAAEEAVRHAAETGRRLGAVTLRIFNVAGAVAGRGDCDWTRVLTKAVAVAARRASHVDVYGDGSAVRDFVHVADVARAIALALPSVMPGEHRAYNVGAVPASVADILAATERVTQQPVPVRYHDAHPGEALDLRADTSRIRSELGWEPVHGNLDAMVADQWAVVRRAGCGAV